MSGFSFTKLFSSLPDSTVWAEPYPTRIVWITMLAMADRRGRVAAAIPGLAHRARVTVDECAAAIETFLSPDRYSRTPDHEGRRIEVIDGGWRLLNYEKYRELRDEESRREQNREAKRRQRERESNVSKSADSQQCQPRSAQAEAEAEAEADVDPKSSKAVHLPMHAVAGKDHHHDDGKPAATANSQSTFAWAMAQAPNGTPADQWAAWVGHTMDVFRGTDDGLRRKLLAEAGYLETCDDPAAVIEAAIADGDDCLPNDWMDEPAGRPHRGAGGESATMAALKAIGALDGRNRGDAITADFTAVPPVPELSRDGGTADDPAAYRAAKDGE